MVLRRVAVGIALTVVIVLGLVSEIGSIATYAGFVTAGVLFRDALIVLPRGPDVCSLGNRHI